MKKHYLLLIFLFMALAGQAQSTGNDCEPIDSISVADTMGTFIVFWGMNDTALAYNIVYRKLGAQDSVKVSTLDTFLVIEENRECVDYAFEVRTVCPFDTTAFFFDTVMTYCPSATYDHVIDANLIEVYPIPFDDEMNVHSVSPGLQIESVSVYQLNGKQVIDERGSGTMSIPTARWSKGVYLMHMQTNKGSIVRKVVKM